MVKRAPAKRRPRKAKPGTKGLTPNESILEKLEGLAADAAAVVEKLGGHLVASYVVAPTQELFWTPNGRHRLAAMRRLGARSISALIVVDREVAWQILALNTEKAHNLKERSLEVIRSTEALWTMMLRSPNQILLSTLKKAPLSLLASATNASRVLAEGLITPSCGG